MGHGRRGSRVALLCALLLGAFASPSTAVAAISVADVQVAEAAGTVSATFSVTRAAGPFSSAQAVTFETVAQSATAPADYVAAGGTLAFNATFLFAETQTRTVTVTINDDALDEDAETFGLAIAGAEVADGAATATIADDDPQPSLSVADSPPVGEGAAAARATFDVRLSAPSGRPVSVGYATADAGAAGGQDYTARSGRVVIAPGATRAPIDVAILDDRIDEPAESFELRLSAPAFASLGDGVATATIADDDEPPAPTAAGGDATPRPSRPATALPVTGPGTPGGSSVSPVLGVSAPRLRRPWTALVTVACPASAGRCSGKLTLFSIPNRRSKIRALRLERRLGSLIFALAGGRARTLALTLGRSDRALLRRTGRMRVRAYALTRDGAGRAGVRRVSGTLIARTAHSSPRRP